MGNGDNKIPPVGHMGKKKYKPFYFLAEIIVSATLVGTPVADPRIECTLGSLRGGTW